jgi:hypothetical protein
MAGTGPAMIKINLDRFLEVIVTRSGINSRPNDPDFADWSTVSMESKRDSRFLI